jgi:bacteriorhodopsin
VVAEMAVRRGEVVGALLTFIVFVVFPLAVINVLPAQTLSQLSAMGFDVQELATGTAMLGLIISAIALAKAIVEKTSIIYLILDVSSNIVFFTFALIVVGVGNIENLGYSSYSFNQGKVTTEIVLDLRVFIYLTLGVVMISVLQSIAKFRETRIEFKQTPQLN